MTRINSRPFSHFGFVIACLLAAGLWLAGCGGEAEQTVVVYTSVDPPFARQVFAEFEKETGIRVKPLFDPESNKTMGLVQQLLREKNRPRADVWWSGEWFGTLRLAEAGVLAEYESPVAADLPARFRDPAGLWTAFAARPRVLVYNTKHVARADLPTGIDELTAAPWKGRLTMANPKAGTTRGWAAAMIALKGREAGRRLLENLRASCPVISAGNSDVVRLVARAATPQDIVVGLTDADDVWVRKGQGEPVDMIYLDQGDGAIGTLLIPNSVAVVRGGPHADAARRLIDFLVSAKVETMLAESRSRNVPLRPAVAANFPQLRVDRITKVEASAVGEVYASREFAAFLRETFGR